MNSVVPGHHWTWQSTFRAHTNDLSSCWSPTPQSRTNSSISGTQYAPYEGLHTILPSPLWTQDWVWILAQQIIKASRIIFLGTAGNLMLSHTDLRAQRRGTGSNKGLPFFSQTSLSPSYSPSYCFRLSPQKVNCGRVK